MRPRFDIYLVVLFCKQLFDKDTIKKKYKKNNKKDDN